MSKDISKLSNEALLNRYASYFGEVTFAAGKNISQRLENYKQVKSDFYRADKI